MKDRIHAKPGVLSRAHPDLIRLAWLMQVIKGRLYVGSRAQAQNWTLLQSLGITHILNVSRDSKEPFEGMLLNMFYLLVRCSPT